MSMYTTNSDNIPRCPKRKMRLHFRILLIKMVSWGPWWAPWKVPSASMGGRDNAVSNVFTAYHWRGLSHTQTSEYLHMDRPGLVATGSFRARSHGNRAPGSWAMARRGALLASLWGVPRAVRGNAVKVKLVKALATLTRDAPVVREWVARVRRAALVVQSVQVAKL